MIYEVYYEVSKCFADGLYWVWREFCVSSASVLAAENHQVVTKIATRISVPAAKNFTGNARVESIFNAANGMRSYGGYVTFEPGARTYWHSHKIGQILIVTSGIGLTQEWGGKVTVLYPGDVVRCPAGVKHWHGASPNTAMTHLAIGETDRTPSATWFEEVTDAQYNGARN